MTFTKKYLAILSALMLIGSGFSSDGLFYDESLQSDVFQSETTNQPIKLKKNIKTDLRKWKQRRYNSLGKECKGTNCKDTRSYSAPIELENEYQYNDSIPNVNKPATQVSTNLRPINENISYNNTNTDGCWKLFPMRNYDDNPYYNDGINYRTDEVTNGVSSWVPSKQYEDEYDTTIIRKMYDEMGGDEEFDKDNNNTKNCEGNACSNTTQEFQTYIRGQINPKVKERLKATYSEQSNTIGTQDFDLKNIKDPFDGPEVEEE